VSHLRFGPQPIRSHLPDPQASFVACHQFGFLERYDVLKRLPGAHVPAEQPLRPGRGLGHAAAPVQEQIIEKKLKFYVIDAYEVAKNTGMGGRINTIMQTCFFALSGVLPARGGDRAIKESIKKTYGKRARPSSRRTIAAVDARWPLCTRCKVPAQGG
jgi:pyruvate-ferredoxin/flavodoxin oxidoreductase